MAALSARLEKTICYTLVAVAWLFFFVQALHTPTILDDWYQVAWNRTHPFGLASLWDLARFNFLTYNPRMGELVLMLLNGPRWIHLLATPLVELAFLPLTFVIAFARWPRLCLRDLGLLLVLQTLIWLLTPVPGVMYFYRPYTTNYLWAFVAMFGLFAPYRLELARTVAGGARWWRILPMLVLGWLAGMGNEHTGLTAMLVMAICLYVARRMGRLRMWMIAGAIGVSIGTLMLLLAPGQSLRYGGMGSVDTPMKMLATRGIGGTVAIMQSFIMELEVGLVLVIAAVLVGHRRVSALTRGQVLTIFALLLSAGGIIATLFASPSIGERLYFAPAVLVATALLVVVEWLFADRGARRFLIGAFSIVCSYQALRMVTVLADGYGQNQARMTMLRNAAPNSNVEVPPYDGNLWKRSAWWWGDDFQFASLREYVANEVYDLHEIEFDRRLKWAEPTPVDHFVVERTFDPPLSPEQDAALEPRYVPSAWEWALVQMRRSLFFGPIGSVEGHRLVSYRVSSVGGRFIDPKGRPVRVFEWTPEKLRFVDGRMFDENAEGQTYIRVWEPSMPADVTDVYVESCGQTTRVETKSNVITKRSGGYNVGPVIPMTLSCRGAHTAYVCQATLCWLAGRVWL